MSTNPAGRPALEVADILRAHGAAYAAAHPVSPQQAAVMRHLVQCRTAALGGHVEACDQCDYQRVSYNSCRDRHCPKCQATHREQWIEARLERILPVAHFHVVFTIPEELQPLMLRNQALLYDLLFKAASQTLLQLAGDPQRLGAQIGFSAILHTWGQNLLFHPHLHCVVTAGGLTEQEPRWIPARPGYLFPVKVISRLFRGKFLAGVQQLYQDGRLTFRGSTGDLADPTVFAALRNRLYRREWVVYAKPPFGSAEHVYQYLGRYSHRVAISNSRLLGMDGGQVNFRYKDYRAGDCWKVMRLSAQEFIRRFLLHVLPKRFVRIRHYGLLSGRHVKGRLEQARRLLSQSLPPIGPPSKEEDQTPDKPARCGMDAAVGNCPRCQGVLIRRILLAEHRAPSNHLRHGRALRAIRHDSS